jgi:hypothetical protein
MDKRITIMEKVCADHRVLIDAHGTTKTGEEKNTFLLAFCKSFVGLVNTINPNESPKLFQIIFDNTINLKDKNVLNAHLHVARVYADHVIQEIETNLTGDYSMQYISVAFDYYKLLNAIEECYGLEFTGRTGNRNMQVDSYSTYKVARQIFTTFNKVSYSLAAYTIFGIRQALELGSKEIIGLENILSKNGQVFLYGSQIPWDFLVMTHPHPYMRVRFDPHKMFAINKWAHSFVHTGKNSFCFTVFLALETVKELYTNVTCIDNYGTRNFYHSTLILNFDKFKRSFESYLRLKYGHSPKQAKWLRYPKLATTFSLFSHPIIDNDFSRYVLYPNIPERRNYANTGFFTR